MESVCALSDWSRFPVKLICCIAFGSVSKSFYLNLLQIACNVSLKWGWSGKQPVV